MKKVEDRVEEQEVTKEEMDMLKKRHLEFLNENIEVLNVEHEYERLITEIDEFRTKRLVLNLQYTKMQNESKKQNEPNLNEGELREKE